VLLVEETGWDRYEGRVKSENVWHGPGTWLREGPLWLFILSVSLILVGLVALLLSNKETGEGSGLSEVTLGATAS
jgi:hypothetical protein